MSIPSRCNDADHSHLAHIHSYLIDGPIKKTLGSHNHTFYPINSIKGNCPAYRKFTNGLIDAGALSPRHVQPHQLPTLKQQLTASSNPNGQNPPVYADSVDFYNVLATTPIVYQNMSHLAPPLPSPATTTTTTTTTTTVKTSSITMTISYHGTKTFAGALDILKHGYDPAKRAGQSYGPGEYHSDSFSTANGYGPYVLTNLVLQHNMTSPGSNVFVTNNPISAYHSVTYMLPLFLCCTDNNTPLPPLAAHVFPDVKISSIIVTAPPQSFQQFITSAIRSANGNGRTFTGDHSRLRALDQLWVENGIKHYLKSQNSHTEYSHINPIAGLAPCFINFVNLLVSMGIVKPRQQPNGSSALNADSVDLWASLVTPAQNSTLQQIGQTLPHTMSFSFYGTNDPQEATKILSDGYLSPPPTSPDFGHVKDNSFVMINLVVTQLDTTSPFSGQSAMCPLGVLWITNSTPLPLSTQNDVDPSITFEVDESVDPYAPRSTWSVQNHKNDNRPANRPELPPNPMSNDVSGYIDTGYRKWVQSGKQPALAKLAYLSTNVDNYFFLYIIDFATMHQINTRTKVVRPVYRS